MQVNPGSPSPALLSSGGLRQLNNTTPQLSLPAPVSATVVSSRPVPGAAALYQGELQLALTTELLSYVSASALPPGQSIRLQANNDGSFQATPITTPPAPTQVASSALAQALRDLLPLTRSGAFGQLLESLRVIQQSPEPALPDPALLQARALLEAIPKVATTTTTDALQAWIDPQMQSIASLLAQGQAPARGHPQQRLANLLQALPAENPGTPASSSPPETSPLIYERLPIASATTESNAAAAANPASNPAANPAGSASAATANPAGVAATLLELSTAFLPGAATPTPSPASPSATAPFIILTTPLPTPPAPDSTVPPIPLATPPPSDPAPANLGQAALPLGEPIAALRQQISAILADQHLRQAIVHLAARSSDVVLPSHLQSLPQDGQQVLLFTSLPLQYGQQFHQVDLQIGQRQGGRAKGEHDARMTWVISLGFNLEALGRVVARSEIVGRQLEATFWSERDTTRLLIEHELPQLSARLQDLGLEVARLQTLAGMPPGSADPAAVTTSHLVDLSV